MVKSDKIPGLEAIQHQGLEKLKVGFIGLGLMGNPMAKNILKKGFDLTVYNRTVSKSAELKKLGVKIAFSPAELAKTSDIIITMVTGPEDVKEIVSNFKNKGLIVVDMSTVGPTVAKKICQKLKKYGVEFLDAPVTGSVIRAQTGELTVFVGGDKKAFEKAKPVLSAMGTTIHYLGESGKGQAIKLINNLLVGETITALAEGMILADALNLPRQNVMDALSDVPAVSPFMKLKMPNFVNNKYPTAFSLANMSKDLTLALKEAKQKPLSVLKTVEKLYKKGLKSGLGDKDLSAILEVLS